MKIRQETIRIFKAALFGFALIAALTSCLDMETDYKKQLKLDEERIVKYLTDNGIEAQRDNSGFYYLKLNTNPSGTQLKQGDIVKFRYSVSLFDGTLVESNFNDQSAPMLFKLQTYTIIPEGLDLGVKMMRTGEKFRFFMPSSLAFGSFASADFVSYSNLIIDIEVVGVTNETAMDDMQRDSLAAYMAANYPDHTHYASGLYFVDSIPGTGNKPFQQSGVKIDFKRMYLDNTLIRNATDVSFYLNTNQAVVGLEEGLRLMKEGGTAILFMPSSIGFKNSVCIIPQKTKDELVEKKVISLDVLPYSILKYIVKLKTVN